MIYLRQISLIPGDLLCTLQRALQSKNVNNSLHSYCFKNILKLSSERGPRRGSIAGQGGGIGGAGGAGFLIFSKRCSDQ